MISQISHATSGIRAATCLILHAVGLFYRGVIGLVNKMRVEGIRH